MITRDLTSRLKAMVSTYPVTTLTGPRQSGKSTLLKNTFPDYDYVSLEDLDTRLFAQNDPRGFLATYPERVIIDEAQRVPDLFSYIQTHVDKSDETGIFILAGSNNFLLMEAISQSLAGRTAVLKLLPFSHHEMKQADILPRSINEEIFTGNYPRIYAKGIAPPDFYPFYIQTYIEKDVRQVKNIGDLNKFIMFIKLCAGRIGQLISLSSLSNDCGIAVSTAQSWLSVLEASYIIYLLKPDHNNYSKRLVKSPKLYFYDTGLACSLLGIKSADQIASHFLRGGLFENMVINEFVKDALNKGAEPEVTFWRDKAGNEVDMLQYDGSRQIAYEIKSGATFSSDYFTNLSLWAKLSGATPTQCNVVYGGEKDLKTSQGAVMAWGKTFP